ncbi:tyrosine-type recombinase/integrase [Hymenobacter coalescens]
MTILLWFRKNTRALSRPGTIMARVTVDKARCEFATTVRCHKADWDATRQQLKGRSDQVRADNRQLEQIRAGLQEAYNTLGREGVYITPERVVLQYQKPQARRATLLQVFSDYAAQRRELVTAGQLSPASAEADRVRLNLLEQWLEDGKLTELRPAEFTQGRAEQFVQWLRAGGRKKNYALKVTQTLKSVLAWCVRQEFIDVNPLQGFQFRYDQPDAPIFLTPGELVKLWFYNFENLSMRRVADVFLFQCFTGLAWRDMFNFRGAEHLAPKADGSIMMLIDRQKSDSRAMMPMSRPALQLLAKYGGDRLPVPSNQYYNRTLKQIAYLFGWQKHLTTHVGRKTAGMILLQDGVSLTIVSRVLGHRSVSVTEKYYARVLSDTVTNEMAKVYGGEVFGVQEARRPFLAEFSEQLQLLAS